MAESVFEEWEELASEYKALEKQNEVYLGKLSELNNLQQNCLKQITHQRYRIGVLSKNLKDYERNNNSNDTKIQELKNDMLKREEDLQNIETTLPRLGATYLRVILGNVDVSFLNKEAKLRYKDDFEEFKLISHIACFIVILINLQVYFRPLELLYFFFLVWYYCTLTVRETILKVNGSKIRGWWRVHHLFSIALSAILLTWPSDQIWLTFRYQFYCYNIYVCLVQYLLFQYQKGQLYRLKALGKRDNTMDITIEGFHKWMWRGLSFLLPFLFIAYFIQLANAFRLINLCRYYDFTWHVPAIIVLFIVLFIGNTATTIMVVPDKLKKKMVNQYRLKLNVGGIAKISSFTNLTRMAQDNSNGK
ncbi:unnamed protein product [Brassicogethes aeneus]|uniref:Transmembrane protein 120 homolog n=1 Tax=Brassicogethes aeneus TaxID=1431903 RepID=A0A9P0B6N2_BRAAE|nr:unnamed protein product [Brassicogethes aeneus]